MYLFSKLEECKKDISIAFIGCGKFISMFLSQYNQLQKIKIDTIVDLKIENAKNNCLKSGLSTATVKDIYFDDTPDDNINNPRWRTILMSGLGAGGHGYFVLDITNINSPKHLFAIENNLTK